MARWLWFFNRFGAIAFYYALPHFHEQGNYFKLEATGAPGGDITILESTPNIGEAWGQTLDPPIDVTGATGIRMTCGYDNPTDRTLTFGFQGEEMCVFLAFTDADAKFAAATGSNTVLGEMGGILMNESDCSLFRVPLTP